MHINYILIRSLAVQITAPCEPAACVPREPGSTLHFSSVEPDSDAHKGSQTGQICIHGVWPRTCTRNDASRQPIRPQRGGGGRGDRRTVTWDSGVRSPQQHHWNAGFSCRQSRILEERTDETMGTRRERCLPAPPRRQISCHFVLLSKLHYSPITLNFLSYTQITKYR